MNNQSLLKMVGRTPMIRIGRIFAKLETTNPSGSVKDRMVAYMVQKAEARGELRPGMRIIEATSGNTGVALAMIAAIKGYRFTAVMPESQNIERAVIIHAILAFGAKVVLTPTKSDMAGAVEKCRQLAKHGKDLWLPNQFDSPENIAAHKEGLGQEILEDMNGKIDAFVSGAGSGGTIIGVAQALKERSPRTRIIVIEPSESQVLSGGKSGLHRIQGIGEGFIPGILRKHLNLVDEVVSVKSSDALEMSKKLAKSYGLLVGTSSGANIWAAFRVCKKYRNVITILPDRGERYLK